MSIQVNSSTVQHFRLNAIHPLAWYHQRCFIDNNQYIEYRNNYSTNDTMRFTTQSCYMLSRRKVHLPLAVLLLTTVVLSCSMTVSALATSSLSCAVVGVGVLGTYLCKQLLEDPAFFHTRVTGITKTDYRHAHIRAQVPSDRLVLQTLDTALHEEERFQNVVFCAPPSGFDDYPAAVRQAAEQLWVGPSGGGVFVFTSSGAV
jgi:hypothetical protein